MNHQVPTHVVASRATAEQFEAAAKRCWEHYYTLRAPWAQGSWQLERQREGWYSAAMILEICKREVYATQIIDVLRVAANN